jgi:hypothetical protein
MDRLYKFYNSPNRQLIRCLYHEKIYLKTSEILEKTVDKKKRYNLISCKSKHKCRGLKDAINYYKITGKIPSTIFTRELITILAMNKDSKENPLEHGKGKRRKR